MIDVDFLTCFGVVDCAIDLLRCKGDGISLILNVGIDKLDFKSSHNEEVEEEDEISVEITLSVNDFGIGKVFGGKTGEVDLDDGNEGIVSGGNVIDWRFCLLFKEEEEERGGVTVGVGGGGGKEEEVEILEIDLVIWGELLSCNNDDVEDFNNSCNTDLAAILLPCEWIYIYQFVQ